MGNNLVPWKILPNGMEAGDFAYLYVYHFQDKNCASIKKYTKAKNSLKHNINPIV